MSEISDRKSDCEVLPLPQAYFSQQGEDRWIVENLDIPSTGFLVEVGVGRWKENSNSLYFEQHGWTTILVEPNPRLHVEIRTNRHGQLFECAAGAYNGETGFTLDNEPTVSGVLRTGGERIVVPIRTLDSILQEAGIDRVHILSIDTEGTELEVWSGLTNPKFKPRVAIIEFSTIGLPEDPMRIIRRFLNDGYVLAHVSGGNLIFTLLE